MVKTAKHNSKKRNTKKVLSLFANIGVAEACLDRDECQVVLANELIERRANLYSAIYPDSRMICGDITNSEIKSEIIQGCKDLGVNVIMATPPCQGMSTAGQQIELDERNSLTLPVLDIALNIEPEYILIENVPQYLKTKIIIDGDKILITDIIQERLQELYKINIYVINTKNYSVPQSRERAIILMSRNDVKEWTVPAIDDHIITLSDAIGHLDSVDPYIKDISKDELLELFPLYYEREKAAQSISHWHKPPVHIYRQVNAMMYTPSGKSAFENEKHKPCKKNGELAKGYKNTYKRQSWNMPAYTVTMDNRKISSQENVHPGRFIGTDSDGCDLYSDPRALTLYEIMIVMSLPKDWAIPHSADEAFVRRVIGEGIPPLFIKKLYKQLF